MSTDRHGRKDAPDWQRIAASIAPAYATHPAFDAAFITGSVARGWADEWSDLDLVLCWADIPSDEGRASLATLAGARQRRAFAPDPVTLQVDEEIYLDGLKVDLIHVAAAGVMDILDSVTIRADESARKQGFVAGIRDGIPVAGADTFRAWRQQTEVYPAALRRAMVLRNLVFGPQWWLEMLADRNDLLLLHQTFCRIDVAILNILFALNGTYPPGESPKWFARIAGSFVIAPPDLATRLKHVMLVSPVEGVREAASLIDETLSLVEAHAPDIDIEPVRARVSSPRRS